MSRGKRSLCTMVDDWAGGNITANNENWYSTIIANKGEDGIANDFSTTRNRISDLEAQLEELKTKKKRRKLKIKVKM